MEGAEYALHHLACDSLCYQKKDANLYVHMNLYVQVRG
jgi:hypothetical protein